MFGLTNKEQRLKAKLKISETTLEFASKILLKEKELKVCQQRILELEQENEILKIQLTKISRCYQHLFK